MTRANSVLVWMSIPAAESFIIVAFVRISFQHPPPNPPPQTPMVNITPPFKSQNHCLRISSDGNCGAASQLICSLSFVDKGVKATEGVAAAAAYQTRPARRLWPDSSVSK